MPEPENVPEQEAQRPKPPLRVRVVVVALSVVFALLIFEVFLRAAGYTYPVFYEPDASCGYALRPGAEGFYRREGRAYVQINSDGLRDREHEKRKPADTYRLAVVGDSYAEAFQVEREKAFWSVLERRLAECPALAGRKVEVINFGVSGYGTAQELITLREKVWQYSPDAVLLAVTTNNDVLDNSRALKLTDEIPYFTLDGERLVEDDSFRETNSFRLRNSSLNRLGRWLREHLRFVQAIHEAQGALKSRLDAWRERRRLAREQQQGPPPASQTPQAVTQPNQTNGAGTSEGTPDAEPGTANVIYREPSDDTWREAWRVTEKLLATMNAEVRAHGARFYVVTLSNGIQVLPDAPARETFARRLGVADLFYPERRFKALGEREGFPVYNLAPDLQLFADRHKVFLHGTGAQQGNGHWNEEGHRVAGELLAAHLCDWLTRDNELRTTATRKEVYSDETLQAFDARARGAPRAVR
jgi:hypothetical protein